MRLLLLTVIRYPVKKKYDGLPKGNNLGRRNETKENAVRRNGYSSYIVLSLLSVSLQLHAFERAERRTKEKK